MKILILNWRDTMHPKSGGAELVTMEHAVSWVNSGNTVDWLTASYDGAKPVEVVRGVRILRRAGSLTVYFYVPFYLLLHGRSYDVIVDEAHGFPFFSPLMVRKPVIMFIHEIAGEIWDYMFSFPKNVIGKFLERWYPRIYQRSLFWTDAESTVDELVSRGIPRDHCMAIPCPIIQPGNIEKSLRVGKERVPTFIFVSRVVRMKGIEEVIKSFSFIARHEPKSRLWIVGGGEQGYIDELKGMISEYQVSGSVSFFGQVSENEKYSLMRRAHILLHASVKEGWGLVVLEAALMGTPSVVYNVGGLRDVVKHGKTGIVLSQNSPREMAEEALRLQHDAVRYAAMQKKALAWVKSLTWKTAAKHSMQLLEKAIREYDEKR